MSVRVLCSHVFWQTQGFPEFFCLHGFFFVTVFLESAYACVGIIPSLNFLAQRRIFSAWGRFLAFFFWVFVAVKSENFFLFYFRTVRNYRWGIIVSEKSLEMEFCFFIMEKRTINICFFRKNKKIHVFLKLEKTCAKKLLQ